MGHLRIFLLTFDIARVERKQQKKVVKKATKGIKKQTKKVVKT